MTPRSPSSEEVIVPPGVTGRPEPVPDPSHLDVLLARGRLRATLAMLGPAFIAAVAYVDPGNFATNVQGGSQFGYLLIWVVVLANAMAMLVQYLSAKLGVVTDNNLAEVCREHLPRQVSWFLWLQAELMAMATDIAEFVGAALGLNLLFGVPLFPAGLITGVIAFGVLALQRRGYRPLEIAISSLLGIVLAGFLYQTLRVGPSARETLAGLIPGFAGRDSILLAVGIVGATVMPHVIYLHSAMTASRVAARNAKERRRILRFQRLDIVIALGLAGIINVAMLAVAAKLFHHSGGGISTIEDAHAGLARLVGGGAALAFAVALLASGISSSCVGTFAGQVVMRGFLRVTIPLWLRRAVTMAPALVVLGIGANPTSTLVLSQVVLSFGIPLALVPLVLATGSRRIMGTFANAMTTSVAAWACAALITILNGYLIVAQFTTHG